MSTFPFAVRTPMPPTPGVSVLPERALMRPTVPSPPSVAPENTVMLDPPMDPTTMSVPSLMAQGMAPLLTPVVVQVEEPTFS
jgi:hypothetical protein